MKNSYFHQFHGYWSYYMMHNVENMLQEHGIINNEPPQTKFE